MSVCVCIVYLCETEGTMQQKASPALNRRILAGLHIHISQKKKDVERVVCICVCHLSQTEGDDA
jgi:hypothetical protein